VERAALVMQRLSALSDTLFAGTERTEVLRGLGSFAEETKDNTTLGTAIDFDVEEDLVFDGLATGPVVEVGVSVVVVVVIAIVID